MIHLQIRHKLQKQNFSFMRQKLLPFEIKMALKQMAVLPIICKTQLRMSATGRSYTHNFLKVQCIIIQAVLGLKLMKKFTVTDEKIFPVYKAFDRKN